eukprot:scaffold146166_cov32-Tisochrysis_lutea.AAC.2
MLLACPSGSSLPRDSQRAPRLARAGSPCCRNTFRVRLLAPARFVELSLLPFALLTTAQLPRP